MTALVALIISSLLALVPFPTGQRKALKKGERWDVGCMDIDLYVKETSTKIGKDWIVEKNATITCNSANGSKAYFSCPANADADADPPEVLCK